MICGDIKTMYLGKPMQMQILIAETKTKNFECAVMVRNWCRQAMVDGSEQVFSLLKVL